MCCIPLPRARVGRGPQPQLRLGMLQGSCSGCSKAPARCREAFNYCQRLSPTACKLLPPFPKDRPGAGQGFGLFSDTDLRSKGKDRDPGSTP